MRTVLLILFSCVVNAFGAATTVDVYLDMESGFNGSLVTASLLGAATHGGAGGWSVFPSDATSMRIVTDFDPPLGSPVVASGTTYTDAGSTSALAFRNRAGKDREYAIYALTSSQPRMSMGCFVRVGNFTGATFGSFDLIAMEGDNGEFIVLNFQDFPGADFVFQIHTLAGVGGPIRITANRTYWTTMLWDRGEGRATLKVYDPATWSLVGTSTLALQADDCRGVALGRYDGHGTKPEADGIYHYFDDVMIDFTNASFPILPETPRVVLAPISLGVNGDGGISGAADGALLQIGRSYALTARPAPGHLFNGWTGSTSSPNATLRFVMASNLTFTASFVTNYFPFVKGTYNGLFYDPANTQQHSAGYLTWTVNDRGTYSGKLLVNGRKHRLHGTLAPDGTGSYTISRPNTNALRVYFVLDLTNNTDRLDGYVAEETALGDTVWSSELVLDRAIYNRHNPAPGAGRYTVVIEPDTNSMTGPAGNSVGTILLGTSGTISFAGRLADGTRVSQRSTLSKAGLWPFYGSPYRGLGSILSPVTLDTNQSTTDLSGPLCWFKQSQAGARYYPEGFTNSTTLLGSQYRAPQGTNPVLSLTSAVLSFTSDPLGPGFACDIDLTPQNTILNRSSNKLTVRLSKATGLFAGSVVPPGGTQALPFSGALLQKRNAGVGFYLGTNHHSSDVLLGP
jgi:hypothetical protein